MADESDVMSILVFSTSFKFTEDLRIKSCYEVMQDVENKLVFYMRCGKYLIMSEIFSLKLKVGQSIKAHLIEMRRLFECLSRLGYTVSQDELVFLMISSLSEEHRVMIPNCEGEGNIDVVKAHERILDSLELEKKKPAVTDFMDDDWIDELGDLSCPVCGNKDICMHSLDVDQMDIGSPNESGIFMIDCLITSYESWVLDTGCGNHICNHL